MTTQVPQPPPGYAGPDHATPHTPYPTAPPWAATAPAPPGIPAQAPLPPYGQLLVPFPEEMQNAGRAGAPTWWPIILWTFFLGGLIGLIPTARRAGRARRSRNSVAPYWITWAATIIPAALIWGLLVLPFAQTSGSDWLEHARTDKLQSALAHDGSLKTATGATPKSAQCDAVGVRGAAGDRHFTCLIRFSDDSTGTLDVLAGTDGRWTAVPAAK
jgi:hypothetical protein